MLGSLYFTLLVTGFSVGLSLLIVWIGFPILGFTFAVARGMASLDYRMSAAMMDRAVPPDVLELEGWNLGAWPGTYLRSGSTWQALGYLLFKFPASMIAGMLLSVLLPFFILELLINLAPGVDTGMITGRAAYGAAVGLTDFQTALMPMLEAKDKRKVEVKEKRAPRRDEFFDDPLIEDEAYDDDPNAVTYILSDDGEIVPRYRDELA
jgi:hypothetical protein